MSQNKEASRNSISFTSLLLLPLGILLGYDNLGVLKKMRVFSLMALVLILVGGVIVVNPFQNSRPTLPTPQSETTTNLVNTGVPTSLEGVEAKVLPVPYFNQWKNPDGSTGPNIPVPNGVIPWSLGWVICGAASAVMITAYYGKLEYDKNNENDLKRYTYKDEGQNLSSKCINPGIKGAFGVTAYNSICNMSGYAGMRQYFAHFGLKVRSVLATPSSVRSAIDAGHPLILSLRTFDGISHITVVKGYTQDGRMVMNDSMTNLQAGLRGYSMAGKNALYSFNYNWQINYLWEVYI